MFENDSKGYSTGQLRGNSVIIIIIIIMIERWQKWFFWSREECLV